MKKINNNIKIFSILILIGISIIFLVNMFFKYKIETKIEKQFNNYKFSENNVMAGISTKFENIECNGFFIYNCNIKNFYLETNIDNKNITIIKSNELKINTLSMFKPLYIDLNFKNIELGKELKDTVFFNYKEEEYKNIGKELYSLIENTNLKIKINIDKLNKIEYTGDIEFNIENLLIDINSKFNIYLKEGNYKESITINDEEATKNKEEVKSDLIFPFFAKINSFEYIIKNRNYLDYFYLVYKINAKNILEEKNDLSSFNNFLFEIEDNKILSKEEFYTGAFNILTDMKEQIPKDEKTLTKMIETSELLFNKKIDILKITGKNKNNISIQKSGLFILFDNLNTSKRYLDDSFDINFEKIK